VGLRPTNNNVAGTKIGRSGFLLPFSFSILFFPLFFNQSNAVADIYGMASRGSISAPNYPPPQSAQTNSRHPFMWRRFFASFVLGFLIKKAPTRKSVKIA